MGFTNTEAISILQDVMKGGYLGLLTAANNSGSYTEVSVTGYNRCRIANTIVDKDDPKSQSKNPRMLKNADLILMFEARSAGNASYFGFFNTEDPSTGTLRFWGEITGGLSMSDGTVPVIRVGELKLEVLSS